MRRDADRAGLAKKRGIVLLDGGDYVAPRMSVRVSLANLPDAAYEPIGRRIAELLADYLALWLAQVKATR